MNDPRFDPRDPDAEAPGPHVLNAPNILWEEAVKYDVETNENWRPVVCFVTRRVALRAPSITMQVHGPFTGAAGAAMARTIANALNHYTLGPDLWPALTEKERAYITANKDNPARPGLDDDEIPF